MEYQFNYVDQLSDAEKAIFLATIFRLAQADHNISRQEKEFIKALAQEFGLPKDKIKEVIIEAPKMDILAEVAKIDKRPLALELIRELCLIANSDVEITDEEIDFISDVAVAMNVDLAKVAQINKLVLDRLVWLEQRKIVFEEV